MQLCLNNVCKSYGKLAVLSDLNLSFPVGKISCLLGPSGIGKTTILNIIAECMAPDSGTVNNNFAGRISYLFQESLLLPWLTVLDNVCYLMAEERSRAEKEQEALELLALMELEGCHGQYPAALSGGMARRVALARALACPMPLLLMDEPFTGLDSELKTRIVDVVYDRICLQQRTAVIVTHDIEVAEKIGHHLFFCKKGVGGIFTVEEKNGSAVATTVTAPAPQKKSNRTKQTMKHLALGCDLGSSSVKLAVVDENSNRLASRYRLHGGDALSVFSGMMAEVDKEFGGRIGYAMVCGSMAGGFASQYRANEIAAIVAGTKMVFPDCASIVDIGGESARYIADVDREQVDFSFNGSCSAGTGSFFEDQMTRLGAGIDEFNAIVARATTTPRIAGRCTVFAKTDIIHRQQEGATTPDILRGLAWALVRNYRGTIIRNLPVKTPLVFSGGVAKNAAVRAALSEILELETILSSEESPCLAAIGCAILAAEQRVAFVPETFRPAPPLPTVSLVPSLKKEVDTSGLHEIHPMQPGEPVYLGIDIGSTSTNLVLVNRDGKVLDYQYLRTSGAPLEVAKKGMVALPDRLGTEVNIAAIGTTGSGRYRVGKKLGALTVKDEITAQARGAAASLPEVDTIFEIGGQDSKFIRLQDGQVSDFQMNKVCAAGTGSFVEEQAKRLHIALTDFGPLALTAEKPPELGERCTVFIKSQIEKKLGEGAAKSDIAAGICYSIVHNYLHKVVANNPVGEKICFSGGLAYNDGIVAAFRNYYPSMQVTPYFSVTGALGIALITRDEALQQEKRPRPAVDEEKIAENKRLFYGPKKHYIGSYDGIARPGRKTIGIPRALMMYKMFPMAYNFFRTLGYNVLLSPETNEDIIRRSQQLVEEETCYPVKLILGHMSWLIDRKVDAIFMPSVYTMRHQGSHLAKNYGCVFMQNVAARYAERLGLQKRQIDFLNPVLEMDMGAPELAKAMIGIGRKLGASKVRCAAAMAKGGAAMKKYNHACEESGKNILAGLKEGERVLVLITRAYGLDDVVLSMGIADQLLNRGYTVITLSHLDAHRTDLSGQYPNQYWPFGAHILTGMQIVRNDPRLFAVYLTNHGCGPDSMLVHQSAEIMGDKPWLVLEVDEHYSPVGLVTRVEAFLSSLEAHKTGSEGRRDIDVNLPKRFVVGGFDRLEKDRPVLLPHLFPYSSLTAARLRNEGFDCRELAPTDEISLNEGRALTRTKEYITFTALLGDVVHYARKEEKPHQFVLPQNGGSEADGQFSLTIRTLLDVQGLRQAAIISPLVEELHDDEALWLDVLAGDMVMAALPEKRAAYIEQMEQNRSSNALVALAEAIGRSEDDRPILCIHGDPACVFTPQVNGHLLEGIEQDFRVSWLPLSEYLLFTWQAHGVDITARHQQLEHLHTALGRFSPFAPSFALLRQTADQVLGKLAGGNGRYRLAKSVHAPDAACGVIEIGPLYENVVSLLNLATVDHNKPFLRLQVNGEGKEREKLETFLHFLRKQVATDMREEVEKEARAFAS